jgi:hypothetical protein
VFRINLAENALVCLVEGSGQMGDLSFDLVDAVAVG